MSFYDTVKGNRAESLQKEKDLAMAELRRRTELTEDDMIRIGGIIEACTSEGCKEKVLAASHGADSIKLWGPSDAFVHIGKRLDYDSYMNKVKRWIEMAIAEKLNEGGGNFKVHYIDGFMDHRACGSVGQSARITLHW
jgi:hypothetical protein